MSEACKEATCLVVKCLIRVEMSDKRQRRRWRMSERKRLRIFADEEKVSGGAYKQVSCLVVKGKMSCDIVRLIRAEMSDE